MSAAAISSPCNNPLRRIPLIQRVLKFSCKSISRVVELSAVCCDWNETIKHYGGPVLRSVMPKRRFNFFEVFYKICQLAEPWLVDLAIHVWTHQLGYRGYSLIKRVSCQYSSTPLHGAIVKNRVDTVRLLCSIKGANLNLRDGNNITPLQIACMQRSGPRASAEIVRLLLSYPRRRIPVDRPLLVPTPTTTKTRLALLRPLVLAAASGFADTVKVLLENGAEPGPLTPSESIMDSPLGIAAGPALCGYPIFGTPQRFSHLKK